MNIKENLMIPLDLFENIYLSNIHSVKAKYEFLGEGASRVVYGIDENFVVKISKNKTGKYQCKTENYIYSTLSEKNKKYFCPIVWYKSGMIVMRRAISFSEILNRKHGSIFEYSNIKKDSEFFKNVRKISKHYDLLYPDVKTISSWGILDDKPVLIDYGCTNKLYDYYFD